MQECIFSKAKQAGQRIFFSCLAKDFDSGCVPVIMLTSLFNELASLWIAIGDQRLAEINIQAGEASRSENFLLLFSKKDFDSRCVPVIVLTSLLNELATYELPIAIGDQHFY